MSTKITHYNNEIDILHDIAYLLGRAKSNDEMYRTAVEQSIIKLNIDRMAIFLITGENTVKGTYGTDTEGNIVNENYFTSSITDHSFASEMIKNRTFIGFQKETALLYNFNNVGIGWNGYVTLWDGAEPIGWIACDNLLSGAPLQPSQINTLKMLGFIISQNIVRAKYQEKLIVANNELETKNRELEFLTSKLEDLVFIDPLTQIYNRRALERYLSKASGEDKNNNSSLSFLMIDLDDFKSINDKLGHLAGDKYLNAFAKLLTKIIVEDNFIFARYGGEEFIFSFVGITRDRLEYNAQLILDNVKKITTHQASGLYEPTLTVSIGGSYSHAVDNIGYTELIQYADKALYTAKAKGKDRFLMSDFIVPHIH